MVHRRFRSFACCNGNVAGHSSLIVLNLRITTSKTRPEIHMADEEGGGKRGGVVDGVRHRQAACLNPGDHGQRQAGGGERAADRRSDHLAQFVAMARQCPEHPAGETGGHHLALDDEQIEDIVHQGLQPQSFSSLRLWARSVLVSSSDSVSTALPERRSGEETAQKPPLIVAQPPSAARKQTAAISLLPMTSAPS